MPYEFWRWARTARLSFRISRYGVTRTSLGITRCQRQGGLPRYEPDSTVPRGTAGQVVTYPTRNFATLGTVVTPQRCWVARSFLFRLALRVAAEVGPSLRPEGVWRMASEDSTSSSSWPFLLIVRTGRFVTASGSSAGFSEFPAYSQILQPPHS
jgi:hypothetical protein